MQRLQVRKAVEFPMSRQYSDYGAKALVCEQQTWMTTPTRGEGCRTLVVVCVQDSGIHSTVKLQVALGICIICSTRHTRVEGLGSPHGSRHSGEHEVDSATQQPRYVVCKISGKPHLGFRTQTRLVGSAWMGCQVQNAEVLMLCTSVYCILVAHGSSSGML